MRRLLYLRPNHQTMAGEPRERGVQRVETTVAERRQSAQPNQRVNERSGGDLT